MRDDKFHGQSPGGPIHCVQGLMLMMVGLGAWTLAGAESPAPAGVNVNSRITSVTVFSDRAQVTRVAELEMPAPLAHAVFNRLPGWVDEGSIRTALIPADAGRILDVQVQRNYLAQPADAEAQKLEADVTVVADQLAALDDELAVLEAQARQVDAIRSFNLDKFPKDTAVREFKPGEYEAAVDFVTSSLRNVAKAKRALEQKKRALQPELAARNRRLADLKQRATLEQTVVVIAIQPTAPRATVSLTYMLPGATWEPVHELRAPANGASVTLSSFANVMQTTGEDWAQATLVFSAQRVTETMRIPEVEALTMGASPNAPRVWVKANNTFEEATKCWEAQNKSVFALANPTVNMAGYFDVNQSMQLDNAKRVAQVFEALHDRGTTAQFQGQGLNNVRSDGKPVRVPISAAELQVQHRCLAAPEASLNAARTVGLTHNGKQPLLPGRVGLFLDGAYMGQTETDFVAPGEAASFYLGIADHLKLSRTLDKKQSEMRRGGQRTRLKMAFVVAAENLTESPASLVLTDRVPVSGTDAVKISGIKVVPETKPDTKGLLRWDLNLEPKQRKEFRIEYTVEYDSDWLHAMQGHSSRMNSGQTAPQSAAASTAGSGGRPSAPPPPPPDAALIEQILKLEKKF